MKNNKINFKKSKYFIYIAIIFLLIYTIKEYFKTQNIIYLYILILLIILSLFSLIYIALSNEEEGVSKYLYISKEEYNELLEKIDIDKKIIKEKNDRIKKLNKIINKDK